MNTTQPRRRTTEQRRPRQLLIAVIGLLIGFGMMATTMPSASAATQARGRAPTEPPGSQAHPPGTTFNPFIAEIVNVVKGYMENALLTEILAGMGIGGSGEQTAQQLAAIQRDVKALQAEVNTDFIKTDFERQIELTRPYTASVDQWIGQAKELRDHEAAMATYANKALDLKLPKPERDWNWILWQGEKGKADLLKAVFMKDYGSSHAHEAVHYFSTALEPGAVDGLIGTIRRLIMSDPSITTLTSAHSNRVSNLLAYFEVYQVQAYMLDTMYESLLGMDTGQRNTQAMLTYLDNQTKLLPTAIPDGAGIPKTPGMVDTHDKQMWIVAAGHVTMDERSFRNPPKDDAWWVSKHMNDAKVGGFGDWRIPLDQDLADFTSDVRDTDNVATFLTRKGINTWDTFYDEHIWKFEHSVSPYLVDGHNQTIVTHWATYMSVHGHCGVDWPHFQRDREYTQTQVDQRFRESRGTLLMFRYTHDVNYM